MITVHPRLLSLPFLKKLCTPHVRGKHRVYIQKPYPRPKIMQVIEDLSRPMLPQQKSPPAEKPCSLSQQVLRGSMLTEYELFLSRRLSEMVQQSKDGLVAAFQPPSITGREWREMRMKFSKTGVQLRVFHPRVVRHVFEKTKYSVLCELLPAPLVFGFCPRPATRELAVALKQCPSMLLLACIVYDRALSRNQLENLNNLGENVTDVIAQSIMVSTGLSVSLVSLLSNNYVNTARIIHLFCENNKK